MREKRTITLPFPTKGLNVVAPRHAQPDGTCADCLNVRTFDSLEGRARGGMRPGLAKYCSVGMAASKRVQDLNYVTTIINAAPNTNGLAVRTVVPMVVANGIVKTFNTTTVTSANTGGNATLSSTAPFMFSASLFGNVYITDGLNTKVWNAASNNTSDWTASPGTLPGTPGTAVPRLIESWRGRIVMAGLRTDPHNFWMSALGSPNDWDTAPDVITETQAIEGATAEVGKVGDVINCIIPYSDDVLLFGCDHSIWQLSGDPAASGRLDMISDVTGMAFGRPWCKDDAGTLFFFSSRGGVWVREPNSPPVNISDGSIGPLIVNTDLNTNMIRMVYDDRQKGVHLFIIPIA